MRLGEMTEDDLDDVLRIEAASFPTPWTRANFLAEIRQNSFARNPVLRGPEGVIAYACVWIVGDELKVNNIAVHPERRRMGLGHVILRAALETGLAAGCGEATLEVRPSNLKARRLYERYGFREYGRRRGYYEDTREDAVLMATRLARDLWPGPR